MLGQVLEGTGSGVGVYMTWNRQEAPARFRAAYRRLKAYDWRMGRREVVPEAVRRRVLGLRSRGLSWSEVADRLNDWRIPTGQGGARWYPSTARGLALRGVQELGRCPTCGRELRP